MDRLHLGFCINLHNCIFSMKSFTRHYIFQRITACILLVLAPWFLWNLFHIRNSEYQEIIKHFGSMYSAVLLFTLLISGFYHGYLGVQTICIDYFPDQKIRSAIIFIAGTMFSILGVFGIFSLVRLVALK